MSLSLEISNKHKKDTNVTKKSITIASLKLGEK
jgi:hypothetical protein